jgi:hypothetical protein
VVNAGERSAEADQSVGKVSIGVPAPSKEDIWAWQSIRNSIGVFDSLVMTLLVQGSVLFFVAISVILGNVRALGTYAVYLALGLVFLAAFPLFVGVDRYTRSLKIAVESAIALEDSLWGSNPQDARRITSRLVAPFFSVAQRGPLYYRFWAFSLLLASALATGFLISSASANPSSSPVESGGKVATEQASPKPSTGEAKKVSFSDLLESPVIVAALSISGTLLTILIAALVNDGLAKRRERANRRNSTYDEVRRLGAEYSLLLSQNKNPDAQFLARIIIVNREVNDRFSPAAFGAWRQMEKFFAAGGLPQSMTSTAYSEAREAALDALRGEL